MEGSEENVDPNAFYICVDRDELIAALEWYVACYETERPEILHTPEMVRDIP